MKNSKKGFTRFELVSVIIMILIVVAISIPVALHFVETQRRSMDRQRADRAEEVAYAEYALAHMFKDGEVMYMFTGDTEVLSILRHAPYPGGDYSAIEFPRADKYSDGAAKGSGLAIDSRSKKLEGEELIIVLGSNGEVLYDSWKEKLAAKY